MVMIKGSNTKIKVSQATIDKIKKMGMTAALKSAPKANAEMQEGLRRMYGASRVNAATKAATTVSKPSRAVMARPGSTPKSNAPGAVSGRKVSTTTTSKAAPAKRQSDAQKLVGGIKRTINSSPGASIKKALTSPNKTTSASVAARRKAAADAVKRAGGRTA
jgi:hypothetical protein